MFGYVTFRTVLPGTAVGRNLLAEMERKGKDLTFNETSAKYLKLKAIKTDTNLNMH